MKAKVVKEFPGREDGAVKVRQVLVGETISGELAEVAVREGWAAPIVVVEKHDVKPDVASEQKQHRGKSAKER